MLAGDKTGRYMYQKHSPLSQPLYNGIEGLMCWRFLKCPVTNVEDTLGLLNTSINSITNPIWQMLTEEGYVEFARID